MAFVRACALTDVGEGKAFATEVEGVEVAVVNAGGEYFAIRDECSHASIPLSEGDVDGCEIECWLHGSRFDLRTGEPSGLPAIDPVPVYACQLDGDDVLVDVSASTNA